MTQFKGIKWVWFDLDDTLWDFRANSRELLRAIYVERGFDRWFSSAEEWVDRYEDHNHWLWREYATARISQQFLREDRFRYPLAEAGCPDADAEGRFLDGHYLERLGQMTRLVTGASDLLADLRRRGYKIGVLSNGFTVVQHGKMAVSGLDKLVDMVVLSDDIGVTKPDRRIFDHAISRAGVRPCQCLMIGDNPDTDIAGAIGAGWPAIFFRRDASAVCQPGVCEVSDLCQIARLL
ncbi:MAG: YjjG family noncanonical pyrimidine nucleotidase [Muribaculaceae bacterium]|nr:YjjG family noncanonical pyrimidine nucleotidase [Muribaculaceae bacterium]